MKSRFYPLGVNMGERQFTGNSTSTGSVVPFPQNRNVGKARHVAQLTLAREGRAREHYLRQVRLRLGWSLAASGLPAAQVQQQIHAFGQAVATEMTRLMMAHRREQHVENPGKAGDGD